VARSSRRTSTLRAAKNLWQAIASFFKTNDDLVGNAVEDDIVGTTYPGYNWLRQRRQQHHNGWISLVMH